MKKKKFRKLKTILQILTGFALTNIHAENLTLDKALMLTLESNPNLKAKELEIESKEAAAKQASLLPNPEAEIEFENFGRAESALLFSQLIELGGKRSRRVGVAKTERDIAQLEFEIYRISVLSAAAEKFFLLWEAQENRRYWMESVKLADSVLAIISHRVNEGASPAAEKIRAKVELANKTIKARNSRQRLTTAKYKLAAMWGATNPLFDTVDYNMAEELRDLDTNLIFQKLENSPRMLLQKALNQRQQAEMKLAQAERFTDLELAAGVKREGETGNNMAVLGLSIGIPLFNRNQGGIQAAKLGQKMSGYEKASVENDLRIELRELTATYLTLKSEMEALKSNSLPGTEQAFEEVRKLYLRGKTSFLDLLDIQRSMLELKSAYVESTTQLNIARIRLEAALGTAFEEVIKGGK